MRGGADTVPAMTGEEDRNGPDTAFLTRWADVGRNWGLPRGAARIHALLLAADAPMDAEEIAARAGVARSNASTSLKELRSLGVVRAAPAAGGRRELFEALDDPWEAAANIAAARKAREYDPAVVALSDAAEAAPEGAGKARLAAYAELARSAGDWSEQAKTLPRVGWRSLFRLGAGVAELLVEKKKTGKKKKKAG